ncbi:hypothetical protein Ocin01_17545 [Orchesella cincta]|uniref:Uncharacterized protein n=1 Tax=Orchesella cincta TaxID=48709 RepID=A0A1D2M826_ORCCI|nr:hypothetical protein Ocin01_17545 [Orchesella cincta]
MIDIYDKVHKFKDGKLNVIENYALTQDDVLEQVIIILECNYINVTVESKPFVSIKMGGKERQDSTRGSCSP